ncbi:NACHT domain-containing protein [Streptomyces sp. NPDC090088]|uniref:NACHT domain-containing protein n=1 Tax=Streptomyces sp. NPDC090088 TaxID=3365944 RepID=UPI0038045AF6
MTIAALAARWGCSYVTWKPQPRTADAVNQITGGRFYGAVILADVIRSVTLRQERPRRAAPRHFETSLARVERRIEKGLRGSLSELARIELDLDELPAELAVRPEVLLRREGRASQRLTGGIVQAWQESQHSLLLLGARGAGKTTMLLELATDLVGAARRDLGDDAPPLPVLIDLTDWRSRVIGRRPRQLRHRRFWRRHRNLAGEVVQERDPAAWLVSWLHVEYQIRPGVARKWLKDDGLALLFDGLDEVPEHHRAACVTWLNSLCRQYRSVPIAVVSRTSEFAWLRRPLALNAAAEIQPLTRQKVETYLRGAGAGAAPVRKALASDESLWEVFDAPIWLVIMTLSLRATAETTAESSVEERRRQLLDGFVAAAVHRKRPADRYTPDQTVRWLSQLARLSGWDLRLRRAFIGVPEPERTAESWTAAALVAANTIAAGAVTLPLLRAYGLLVTLATGLVPLGLLLTLAFKAPCRPKFSPFVGLGLGCFVVHYDLRVISGFRKWLSGIGVSWMMHYSNSDPQGGGGPDIDLHQWITEDQFRDFLAIFAPGVLAVVIALAFVRATVVDEPELGIPSILCPLVAIASFIAGMTEGARIAGPFQAYYYGTAGIAAPVLVASMVIALPFLGLRLILEPLSSAVASSIRALRIFTWHLAHGRVPLRLRRFLHQAGDHHLLIRDYSGYRFPHALFREYFASLDPTTAVAPKSPGSESR